MDLNSNQKSQAYGMQFQPRGLIAILTPKGK